jgi:hypothetical protein
MSILVSSFICYVLYVKCYMSNAICSKPNVLCKVLYAKCYMSNAICQVLYVKCYMSNSVCQTAMCEMLWPLLCLLVWLQSRWDLHYIYPLPSYDFSILPLLRRDYYYMTMASLCISDHHLFWFVDILSHRSISPITVYFGLPTYHGIDLYLYHRLCQLANISWHYIITLVIANSSSFIYRDIYL